MFTEEARRQATERRNLRRLAFLGELLAVTLAIIALAICVRWLV